MDEETVVEITEALPGNYYARTTDVIDMYSSTSIYRRRWWWFDKIVADVNGRDIEFSDRKAFSELERKLVDKGFNVTLR